MRRVGFAGMLDVYPVDPVKDPKYQNTRVRIKHRGGRSTIDGQRLAMTPRAKEDLVPDTVFYRPEKLVSDLATALARAHRLTSEIYRKAELPYPIIWTPGDKAVTFTDGEHPIDHLGGEYVAIKTIGEKDRASYWKMTKQFPVNFGMVPVDLSTDEEQKVVRSQQLGEGNEAPSAVALLTKGLKSPLSLMAAPAVAALVEEWLMDTACPADLIDRKYTRDLSRHIRWNPNPPTFQTANGTVKAPLEVPITIPELGRDAAPIVMDNSPNVLSLGYRIVEEGYAFYWEPWSLTPVLFTPKPPKPMAQISPKRANSTPLASRVAL